MYVAGDITSGQMREDGFTRYEGFNMTTRVSKFVENLALQHGITYVRSRGDEFAEFVTKMAGDDAAADLTENLLVTLKKSGIIDNDTLVILLGEHLDEKFKA